MCFGCPPINSLKLHIDSLTFLHGWSGVILRGSLEQ
jgi:hypothetical protein